MGHSLPKFYMGAVVSCGAGCLTTAGAISQQFHGCQRAAAVDAIGSGRIVFAAVVEYALRSLAIDAAITLNQHIALNIGIGIAGLAVLKEINTIPGWIPPAGVRADRILSAS